MLFLSSDIFSLTLCQDSNDVKCFGSEPDFEIYFQMYLSSLSCLGLQAFICILFYFIFLIHFTFINSKIETGMQAQA